MPSDTDVKAELATIRQVTEDTRDQVGEIKEGLTNGTWGTCQRHDERLNKCEESLKEKAGMDSVNKLWLAYFALGGLISTLIWISARH